ncbi:alpha/beta hydrolase domain-containing protein [Nocardia sp. 348MFTsu5.1]|uniref:alpha/beta hydrolase domain-containing protein n=1 Tax=Nocardia sp. 348MFTsu5.1 TaxID=1172185 RepID=UPI00036622E0|nr:alpha/beta hydrolase domain-containing protein [Nocardia sp. 348MFTsu5.1]
MAHFNLLPPLDGCGLVSATPGPDLSAADYTEREYSVSGAARSFETPPETPSDRPDSVAVTGVADFCTRVVVRRPIENSRCSGNVVVEWLNVSSGADAAPGYTYLAHELVRNGDIWVGVSAQYTGVAGGTGSVAAPGTTPSNGLVGEPRYAELSHPGDAFCYDIFTRVAAALGSPGGPLSDVDVDCLVAAGESQSAIALTTYVNCISKQENVFHGFLIHSRAAAGLPLQISDLAIDLLPVFRRPAVPIRGDLTVPVLVVQTETDILGDFRYVVARQNDGPRFRLWEIAGSAHADRYQVGPFEEFLGCKGPVNRGQQRFVLRAAIRALFHWARGGEGPPTADRLATDKSGDEGLRFSIDDHGNVRGGVRTPCVEAPVSVLSGVGRAGESRICRLFGSTEPIDPAVLTLRYRDADTYMEHYAAAVDAVIAAGFALEADRAELLDDAEPDALA